MWKLETNKGKKGGEIRYHKYTGKTLEQMMVKKCFLLQLRKGKVTSRMSHTGLRLESMLLMCPAKPQYANIVRKVSSSSDPRHRKKQMQIFMAHNPNSTVLPIPHLSPLFTPYPPMLWVSIHLSERISGPHSTLLSLNLNSFLLIPDTRIQPWRKSSNLQITPFNKIL